MQSKSISHLLPELKGLKTLVVEDNALNALVVQKLLTKWGISSDLAVNGKFAIEKVFEKAYDFILMDIHMPVMNGYEATEYIKTNQNPNFKTPIFALTIDFTAGDKKQYVQWFSGFLQKPLQIEILLEALLGVGVVWE